MVPSSVTTMKDWPAIDTATTSAASTAHPARAPHARLLELPELGVVVGGEASWPRRRAGASARTCGSASHILIKPRFNNSSWPIVVFEYDCCVAALFEKTPEPSLEPVLFIRKPPFGSAAKALWAKVTADVAGRGSRERALFRRYLMNAVLGPGNPSSHLIGLDLAIVC